MGTRLDYLLMDPSFGAVVHDYDLEEVLQQVASTRQRASIVSGSSTAPGVAKVESIDS